MGILVGLIIILAFAPLPFGSATVFWQSVLAALSLTLAAATILTHRRALTWPPAGQREIGWAAGLFGLTLVWAVFQGLVPGFGAHPAWMQVEDILGGPVAGTISLDPFASLADAISLAGIGAVFLVSLFAAGNPRHARILINAIAIVVAAYAVYGIVVYVSGNSSVAWAEKRHYLDALTSTFVNRNSFGVFAGLGALCAVAIFANSISAITGSGLSSRDRFRILIEAMASRMWIWIVAALACVMALLLTGSRAATAATALALLFFILIYLSARRASARTTAIIILSGFVGALILLNLSGEFLLFRLDDKFSDGLGSRADIYANALTTLRDHLWLGAGYGTFGDAYAIYGSGDGTFSKRVEFAHNVYIEMAIELGLPMAIAFFASVGLAVFVCIRGIVTRRRDRIYAILAIAATILVGVQGVVDFGIQTPAIATLYAALLGIGVAQSVSSRKTSGR
ncbi:O-antigen ligase family protein [Pyruvatibacter sp.]|uniref:O-antigen ligase family protein n=1 Tax=Pyruvatibacter sp. TaxID=1981328 RepID=UPI0032675E63